jgi:hypothetical protein
MTRSAPTFLLILAVSAAAAAAQDAAPAGPTPTPATSEPETQDASATVLASKPNPFFQEAPPSDSDGRARSVSPAVAAALAEGLPKFSPPTPTPTPEAGEPEDMRDVDRPRNEIKRLPKFVVQESRPPIFRQRDLFTSEGLADLAFKAHPGLLFGNFLGLNSGVAQQMLEDDQRLENISDLKDTAHAMILGGDVAEGEYILQKSQETYMRTNDDWMTNAPGAPGDWIK